MDTDSNQSDQQLSFNIREKLTDVFGSFETFAEMVQNGNRDIRDLYNLHIPIDQELFCRNGNAFETSHIIEAMRNIPPLIAPLNGIGVNAMSDHHQEEWNERSEKEEEDAMRSEATGGTASYTSERARREVDALFNDDEWACQPSTHTKHVSDCLQKDARRICASMQVDEMIPRLDDVMKKKEKKKKSEKREEEKRGREVEGEKKKRDEARVKEEEDAKKRKEDAERKEDRERRERKEERRKEKEERRRKEEGEKKRKMEEEVKRKEKEEKERKEEEERRKKEEEEKEKEKEKELRRKEEEEQKRKEEEGKRKAEKEAREERRRGEEKTRRAEEGKGRTEAKRKKDQDRRKEDDADKRQPKMERVAKGKERETREETAKGTKAALSLTPLSRQDMAALKEKERGRVKGEDSRPNTPSTSRTSTAVESPALPLREKKEKRKLLHNRDSKNGEKTEKKEKLEWSEVEVKKEVKTEDRRENRLADVKRSGGGLHGAEVERSSPCIRGVDVEKREGTLTPHPSTPNIHLATPSNNLTPPPHLQLSGSSLSQVSSSSTSTGCYIELGTVCVMPFPHIKTPCQVASCLPSHSDVHFPPAVHTSSTHYNDMAVKLKKKADHEMDRVSRAFTYLESSAYFLLHVFYSKSSVLHKQILAFVGTIMANYYSHSSDHAGWNTKHFYSRINLLSMRVQCVMVYQTYRLRAASMSACETELAQREKEMEWSDGGSVSSVDDASSSLLANRTVSMPASLWHQKCAVQKSLSFLHKAHCIYDEMNRTATSADAAFSTAIDSIVKCDRFHVDSCLDSVAHAILVSVTCMRAEYEAEKVAVTAAHAHSHHQL